MGTLIESMMNLHSRFLQYAKPRDLPGVRVEEVFAHCTKCMVRSGLWKPESWKPEGLQFTIGSAMVAHGTLELSVQEMQAIADERVRTSLSPAPAHYSLMGQLFPKPRVANDSGRSTDSQRLPFARD